MKEKVCFRVFPESWKEGWGDEFDTGNEDLASSFLDDLEDLELLSRGESEEGRPLMLWRWGRGPIKVSLLAGCHSDEPLGPHVLRRWLKRCTRGAGDVESLLETFSFYICPHINPDGENKNLSWVKKYPDFDAYVEHAFREKPGRDLEFGFPEMRKENVFWAQAMEKEGPFDLHLSLHGMGYSEGYLLLIERHVQERCVELQESFSRMAKGFGVGLHDHDRKGDKGFLYFGAGFSSTPEGKAMKGHFLKIGDELTASKFHLSSMEWMRSLGGDPVCLVSELPLFYIRKGPEQSDPGTPTQHMALRKALGEGHKSNELLGFQLEALGLERGCLSMLSLIDMALVQVAKEKGFNY
jgi:hypothetical protein